MPTEVSGAPLLDRVLAASRTRAVRLFSSAAAGRAGGDVTSEDPPGHPVAALARSVLGLLRAASPGRRPCLLELRHRGRPGRGEELDVNMLDEWTDRVIAALGLDPADIDRDLVLDLARDVAHNVARPAAPLTVFLVGLAAGRAGGDAATLRDAAEHVRGLLPASRRD